jgi:RNA polymerase sigma-70 factor (ECF subfamily)
MSLIPNGCAPATSGSGPIHESESEHVWRLLRSLGVKDQNLEDAVQEVFVVAHARLSTFDASRPIRPWLFGIALRIVFEMRRATCRIVPAAEMIDVLVPEGEPDPAELMAEHEARAMVRDAVDRLDLDQREVLILHDIDGLSAPEIAETLSAPPDRMLPPLRLSRPHPSAMVATAPCRAADTTTACRMGSVS